MVIDFRHAMKQVIKYILSLKEKNIAYLGAYEKVENEILYGERRKKFFLDVLKRQGLYQKALIKVGVFTQESGYKNMQKILQDTIPDIVFCANDSIAYGALKAIHEKALNVPNDIKIIGFNDNTESRYITPSLTTLHIPTFEMGEEAFLSCMQMIKRPNRLPVKKVLPTKLMIRQST
ncbi:MAG: substrate-binding domain-containing protein [Bacillota bacterium]